MIRIKVLLGAGEVQRPQNGLTSKIEKRSISIQVMSLTRHRAKITMTYTRNGSLDGIGTNTCEREVLFQ